jgi:hypothetical protein
MRLKMPWWLWILFGEQAVFLLSRRGWRQLAINALAALMSSTRRAAQATGIVGLVIGCGG